MRVSRDVVCDVIVRQAAELVRSVGGDVQAAIWRHFDQEQAAGGASGRRFGTGAIR